MTRQLRGLVMVAGLVVLATCGKDAAAPPPPPAAVGRVVNGLIAAEPVVGYLESKGRKFITLVDSNGTYFIYEIAKQFTCTLEGCQAAPLMARPPTCDCNLPVCKPICRPMGGDPGKLVDQLPRQ